MYTTSLQGLRIFCAVAKAGSFKIAAEEIFVSPSAISHRIKKLEERLGSPVFLRKTRSIELTNFGKNVFTKISPLIEKIDKELAGLSQIESNSSIKITLPAFFSTEIFLPRLQAFIAANENIMITLDTVNGHPDKHVSSSDLSIILCDNEPAGVNAIQLFPLVLVPACAPGMQTIIEELSPENLANTTLLIHGPRREAWKKWFRQNGNSNLKPKNVMVLDNMMAVVRAAEQGLGLALVPDALIGRWLDEGTLVEYSKHKLITDDSYYVTTESKNLENPQVAKFNKWIVDTFQ